MPKTKEQIEKLKEDWLSDPCWDISNTEGFEDHYEELKAFEDNHITKWDREFQKKKTKTIEDLKKFYGDNIWQYVYYLEEKLKDYYTIKEQVKTLVAQCQRANILTQEDNILDS